MKRAGIYLRVSTNEQTTDNQRVALEAIAKQRGWDVAGIYSDQGISGSKGRDKRPAFDKLLKDAVKGKLDVVAAWSVDRLGRSLQDVIECMNELMSVKVDLYIHQQAVDSSTSGGKAMLSMCAVFAEFERNIIVERVRAGIARAKASGTKFGRPKISPALEQRIRELRSAGHGFIKTAKLAGVGVGTVQRVVCDG
jgi:DNA invertase Pin-like site-specific DNA recombinase